MNAIKDENNEDEFLWLPEGVPIPTSVTYISVCDNETILPPPVPFNSSAPRYSSSLLVCMDTGVCEKLDEIQVEDEIMFNKLANEEGAVNLICCDIPPSPCHNKDVSTESEVSYKSAQPLSQNVNEVASISTDDVAGGGESSSDLFSKSRKRRCAAKTCVHATSDERLYTFPSTTVRGRCNNTNVERCKEWVRICDSADLIKVPVENLHNKYFLCGKHFDDSKFYNQRTRMRLLPNAIPVKCYEVGEAAIDDPFSVADLEGGDVHDFNPNDILSVNSKKCCFKDCDSFDKEMYHTFPRIIINNKLDSENVERCKLWVQNSGNSELLTVPTIALYRNYFVCGKHFENDQYYRSMRKTLVHHAIPSGCEDRLSDECMKKFPILGHVNDVFANHDPLPDVLDKYQKIFFKDLENLKMFTCAKCKETFLSRYKPKNSCLHGKKCKNFTGDNNMDPGEIPEPLRDLSFIEEQLIARIHPLISVFKIKGHQFGYRGNVINFNQRVNELAKRLPHNISNLSSVVTVRTKNPLYQKDFYVRAGKIRNALIWLKANNKFYHDIEISEENLSNLPEDGDVYHLLPNVDLSSDDCEMENDGINNEDPSEDADDSNSCDIAESCVLYEDSGNQDDQAMNVIDWPSKDKTPLNEFATEGLLCQAFPTLFPSGDADLNSFREDDVGLVEYFKHLFRFHDNRFETHPRFRYYAFNLINRWHAIDSGNVFINKNENIKNMTVEKLKEELKTNPGLMKKVMYQCSNMRGTRMFWKARYQELVEMIEQLGMPTLFFTLSAADLHWPGLFKILAPDEDVDTMTSNRRRELVAKYPITVDKYFSERVNSFITKVLKPKFVVTDFWFRVEYQHRGSPHVHGILWLDNAPDVSNLFNLPPEDIQKVLDYFDSLITAVHPDQSAPPAVVHPCQVKLQEIIDLDKDLAELINKVQRHTRCTPGYCLRRNKTTKQNECRFKFPQKLNERSEINFESGEPQYVPERNDPLLNKYNSYMLQTWRANIDISPVLSKRALINYLAKYVSKSEIISAGLDEILNSICEKAKNGCRSVLQSLLIRFCSERDYSAQEVGHIIMGEKMFSAGKRNFVYIFFHLHDDWLEVTGDDNDVKRKKSLSIIEKYMARKDLGVMKLSLWTMAKNYSFVTSKKVSNQNIVMVYPKIKFNIKSESNEKYYRQQVLLYVPWTKESDFEPDKFSWKEIYDKNVHIIKEHQSERTLDFEGNRSNEELEDVEDHSYVMSREDWMATSAMGPSQRTGDVELGRRAIDVAYDWNASYKKYKKYGSVDELRCFISNEKRKSVVVQSSVDAPCVQLNEEQQKVLQLVNKQINQIENYAMIADSAIPKVCIVQGPAGTGKSLVIRCISNAVRSAFGNEAILLLGPTGVASLNISGSTYHSKLHISQVKSFTDLKNQAARSFCNEMKNVKFIVIDEYSMIGCNALGMIDQRLRQGTGNYNEDFGGLYVYLCGDIRQLPPVKDTPLYSDIIPKLLIGKHGLLVWQNIKVSIVLHQVVRQVDVRFKLLLENISLGKVNDDDYNYIKQRFSCNVKPEERKSFANALKLFATKPEVLKLNMEFLSKLRCVSSKEPIPLARIAAEHNCIQAAQCSEDDAVGLQAVMYLAPSVKIMLRANLWTERGLVNGAMGNIVDIIYEPDKKPPDDAPSVLICQFDEYCGPYLGNDFDKKIVSIPVISRSWKKSGISCTRTQFPVHVAYASTIHKVQGITTSKIEVDISDKEFSPGLTFVAFSRAKSLQGLLVEPFSRKRFFKINNSAPLKLKVKFEQALMMLNK